MGYATSHQHQRPDQPAQPFNLPVVFGPARQAQFAYRVVTVSQGTADRLGETQLNTLGKEGWLLVSVVSRSEGEGRRVHDYLFVRLDPDR